MRRHVATIIAVHPPSSLSKAARTEFGDALMTTVAMMVAELDKGEPWVGTRHIEIEVPDIGDPAQ